MRVSGPPHFPWFPHRRPRTVTYGTNRVCQGVTKVQGVGSGYCTFVTKPFRTGKFFPKKTWTRVLVSHSLPRTLVPHCVSPSPIFRQCDPRHALWVAAFSRMRAL